MEALSVIAIMGTVLWSFHIQASLPLPEGEEAWSGVGRKQDWEAQITRNVRNLALANARWETTTRNFHRVP